MSQYIAYLYEVVEEIGEDERVIPDAIRTEDNQLYLLIERAIFTLKVLGRAWAEAHLSIMRKRYPERRYTYRRIPLNHDPEPPYGG